MNVRTLEGLMRYRDHHIRTGDFLRAVLENNLSEAILRADDENLKDIHEIVLFCYNELPVASWGSPEKVRQWINITGEIKR